MFSWNVLFDVKKRTDTVSIRLLDSKKNIFVTFKDKNV